MLMRSLNQKWSLLMRRNDFNTSVSVVPIGLKAGRRRPRFSAVQHRRSGDHKGVPV